MARRRKPAERIRHRPHRHRWEIWRDGPQGTEFVFSFRRQAKATEFLAERDPEVRRRIILEDRL